MTPTLGRARHLFAGARPDRGVLAGGLGYFAGEAASRGMTFAILIAVARFIPVDSFAWVNLYVILANITALVIGLGLQNAILRFYFRDVSFAGILGTSTVIIIVTGAIAGAAAITLREPLGSLLRIPSGVIVAAAIGGPMIALRASLLASLRARRRVRASGLVQAGEAVIGALLIGGLLVSGALTYESIVMALVASTTVVALAAFVVWARDPGLEFQLALIRQLMTFSLPLVFHGIAVYILGTYGQVLVNLSLGPTEAGRYAYAFRFAMAMLIVSTAFSAAWGPAFLEAMRSPAGRESLQARARSYWMTLLTLAVLLMLGLPIVARVLGGPTYAEAARLIPIMTYAYIWHVAYTLVLGFHIEAGRTPLLAAGSLASIVLGVAITVPAMTWLGAAGAAIGGVAAYFLLFVIQLGLTRASERGRTLEMSYRWIAVTAVAIGVLPAVLWTTGYPWA